MVAGGALVLAGELGWYQSQSGDPLFRAHTTEQAVVSWYEAVGSPERLSYRWFITYPRMMLVPNVSFGLHSLVALSTAALAVRRQASGHTLLLVVWALVPFLYLNFGSAGFNRYLVIPVATRYISLLYAPVFILMAALVTNWAARRPRAAPVVAAAVSALAIVGVSCALATKGTGYRTDQVARLWSD
jgi:hypothetical protein